MLCGVALPSGAVCRLIGQPHHMQAKALDPNRCRCFLANINVRIMLGTCHNKSGYLFNLCVKSVNPALLI